MSKVTAQQTKPKEYKRTCRACGTVWHSLASREGNLKSSQTCDTCLMCSSATSPKGGDFAQYSRNVDAHKTERHRLQTWPKCGSSSYDEELVSY